MKATEYRNRTTADLREEVSAKDREILNLQFRAGSERGTDPSHIKHLRIDVARIKTVLRERALDIRGQAADAASGRSRKAD